MKRFTVVATALALAASAGIASATELARVGGVFPGHSRPLGSYGYCPLGDGSHLQVERTSVQEPVAELRLVHYGERGEPLAPSLPIAFGIVTDWRLDCDARGNAIVAWRGSYESRWRYRLVDPDHRRAGEVREAPIDGASVSPTFAVSDDRYAIAWSTYDPYEVWIQGFTRDGHPSAGPFRMSASETNWQGNLELAIDAGGNTLLAWYRWTGMREEIFAGAVTAGGEPTAEEFLVLVDEAPPLGQGPLGVHVLDDGLFAVYWSSEEAGGVVAQRIAIREVATQTTTTSTTTSTTLADDASLVFASERGWNEWLDRHWSIEPKLAGDGSGRFAALWSTWYFQDSDRLVSISDDGGRRWSPAVRVPGSPVEILSAGNGEWLAFGAGFAFRDESNRYFYGIELSVSTDAGAAWPEPRYIAEIAFDDDCSFEVNSLAAGRSRSGALVVAWAQTEECDYYDEEPATRKLLAIRSFDNGATWTAPVPLVPTNGLQQSSALRLTPVGGNGFLLTGYFPILRSTDDGGTWSVDQHPGYKPYGEGSGFACDADDSCVGVLLDYPDEGPTGEFVLRAMTSRGGAGWASGTVIERGIPIDQSFELQPSVATDGAGKWVVVWPSHRDIGGRLGLDADLLQSVSTDGGVTWSPPRAISEAAEADGWAADRNPQLVFGAGSWVTLWERVGERAGDYWYARRREARVIAALDGCGDGAATGLERCDDGNLVDGDGCDRNCYATGCGNGIRTAGEECDDGNDLDEDECVECRHAVCGDGVVQAGVEECDDGDDDDADACTNACTNARCGDGIVAAGLEECDDGNTEDADACPATCEAARCGDGFVQEDVEDCEDGNDDDGDACTAGCRAARCGDGFQWRGVELCDTADPQGGECPAGCGVAPCGDANGNGEVEVDDSLEILLHAVGGVNDCPMETCDVDRNVWINTRDALTTLGLAVGLPYRSRCDFGPWVTIRLQDARRIGALQIAADASAAPVRFLTSGINAVVCESLVPGALVGAALEGTQLNFGIIAVAGFQGPLDVGRCRVEVSGEVRSSQFVVSVVDVTDVSGNLLEPAPVVTLRGLRQ